MSGDGGQAPTAEGLDELLDRLERAIARLAEGDARLDDLVGAYDEARELATRADAELERVTARLGPAEH